MHRRALLALAFVVASCLACLPLPLLAAETVRDSFAFAEATIDELQGRMAAGKLTAHALAAAYLQRISDLDDTGPELHAVLEVNPEALAIADALDAERAAGRVRGPLHGIPVLLKDNIATGDSLQTTAGSIANVGVRPTQDAFLVRRLRRAGAVILGKANLSEWANFRGKNSVGGWSARGGQTRNPYALDRSPSGSSSGSAVAVAANLCAVAIGTETDGSIVSPAAHCGIVGVKPTVGLVSRSGIIPISATQDTAGPMTRTVRDAAIMLAVLAGTDPLDPATAEIPAALAIDFASALRPDALRGARLGVMRKMPGFHPRTEVLLDRAVDALRTAGAEVIDPIAPPDFGPIEEAEWTVLCHEFKHGLNAWFAALGPDAPVKSLEDLITFNTTHAVEEMRFFGQETLVTAQAKGPLADPAYLEARTRARQLTREDGIDRLVAEHRLDAIVTLTAGPAWIIDSLSGDPFTGETSTLAAVAGYPSVTVPAGFDFGMPIGISFTGTAWTDAKLLALAADFEARTQARRRPQFLPTVALEPGPAPTSVR